jgi:predicted enzyme related to lactoylglutathione lyase
MPIQNVWASVAVKDLNAAIAWYRRVLDRPPDSRPLPIVAEWKFQQGGGLQVYQLPERAGQGSCSFSVSRVQEQIASLEKLGIDTTQRTSNATVKTVMITDPDGNHIAFAETSDPSHAQ